MGARPSYYVRRLTDNWFLHTIAAAVFETGNTYDLVDWRPTHLGATQVSRLSPALLHRLRYYPNSTQLELVDPGSLEDTT